MMCTGHMQTVCHLYKGLECPQILVSMGSWNQFLKTIITRNYNCKKWETNVFENLG